MIFLNSVKNSGNVYDPREIDDLITESVKGNAEAFNRLYKAMSAPVYAFALSVTGNTADAEDVLQESFVSLLQSGDRFVPEGKGKSYLMAITANHARMVLRKRQKNADLPEEDWMPFQEDEDRLDSYEKILLKECLAALSCEERQIVILHAVTGLKHREIASILHIPLPTVLSKYNRALKRLRKTFDEEKRHEYEE